MDGITAILSYINLVTMITSKFFGSETPIPLNWLWSTLTLVQKSSMVSWLRSSSSSIFVQFTELELTAEFAKNLNWIENFNSVLNCYIALLKSYIILCISAIAPYEFKIKRRFSYLCTIGQPDLWRLPSLLPQGWRRSFQMRLSRMPRDLLHP